MVNLELANINDRVMLELYEHGGWMTLKEICNASDLKYRQVIMALYLLRQRGLSEIKRLGPRNSDGALHRVFRPAKVYEKLKRKGVL